MADEQPPKQNNDPRKPGESGGSVNWRVLILFAIALGLLTLAFFQVGDGAGRMISFSEFRNLMEDGKVFRSTR
jgi:hypothetical protein